MSLDPTFIKSLRSELRQWEAKGLISAEQAQTISHQYPPELPAQSETPALTKIDEKTGRRSVGSRIPAVLCGIAVLLIGIGLILFYAANWRKMPPALKLAQVVSLMAGLYSAAYLFLFVKVRPILGRSFLILGMIVFGAAISLVAQIFHISAHPVSHVLAWTVGVFLLSWVMNERWGMLLAFVLACIWNIWELGEYKNANWLFVIWPVAFFLWARRTKFQVGQILSICLFGFWYYQIHLHAFAAHPFDSIDVRLFVLMHLPLGVVLVSSAALFQSIADLGMKAPLTVAGWFFMFVPFTGLSWPMDTTGFFLWEGVNFLPLLIELAVLTFLGLGLAFLWRSRRTEQVPWHTPLLLAAAFSLLCIIVPNGHRNVLLVTMYCGLLGFHFATLYSAHLRNDTLLKALAFVFAIATIVIKSIGLLLQAFDSENYFVAFGLGGIFFLTVMFLMNEALALILKEFSYSRVPLMAVSTCFAYFVLYGLAFRHDNQESVIGADSVVLLMLGLTLIIVVGFYIFLIFRGADRVRLGLSGVITVSSLVLLFVTGPSLPWEAYSVAFNLLLLIFIGVLVYESVRQNSLFLLNVALSGFVLLLVTRYVDIFWDLLSGSLLFIVTGVLIFGGGIVLERHRRRLAERIKAGQQS